MPFFVVRVWLPDRPGALGAVASRIGSVRADVVGIEILERGAGRAVDELTIDLEDERHVDLLVKEIAQVDGVDVEHVRPARGVLGDRAVMSLDVAAKISQTTTTAEALEHLAAGVHELFGADWTAVTERGNGPALVACEGTDIPPVEWMAAFIAGAGSRSGSAAVDDLTSATLLDTPYDLVLARSDLPLRDVERSILERLAALAAAHIDSLNEHGR
ncbi:MAG: ACT domain-containing protein [Actinobacteria bacterium]|nr:ACT domain-containing protein [Actinomycetota bacterium]